MLKKLFFLTVCNTLNWRWLLKPARGNSHPWLIAEIRLSFLFSCGKESCVCSSCEPVCSFLIVSLVDFPPSPQPENYQEGLRVDLVDKPLNVTKNKEIINSAKAFGNFGLFRFPKVFITFWHSMLQIFITGRIQSVFVKRWLQGTYGNHDDLC